VEGHMSLTRLAEKFGGLAGAWRNAGGAARLARATDT
jgi:hypothetical protein